MATVSIVIPTLFPSKHLAAYTARLASFRRVTEVIVVVNGIGQNYDEDAVHWLFLGKNRGYTGACNEGAHAATGDLLLFLNDDCNISEESLLKMVSFLKTNTDVVATQPVVRNSTESGTGKSVGSVENIGFWIDTRIGKAEPLTEMLSAKCLVPSRAYKKEILNQVQDDTDKKGIIPLDNTQGRLSVQHDSRMYGLSGTCLLIRKDIFDSVGMWDESFHSYLEDVDLAIRLYKAGYIVAPCLDAEVTHAHMATSNIMGLYKPTQDVKNWWRLVCKHPDIFPLTLPLLLERGRNVSGLVKAWASKTFTP